MAQNENGADPSPNYRETAVFAFFPRVKKGPKIQTGTHIGSDLQIVLFKVLFWALFLGKELFFGTFMGTF